MPISRKKKRGAAKPAGGRGAPATSSSPSSRRAAPAQPAPRRKAPQPAQRGEPLLASISPERKMDILGVLLALAGLLTLLSLFSTQASSLTGSWRSMLGIAFGWGVYILPFGLILLGVWLVARDVERLPRLSVERVVGMLLLFVNLLVVLHAFSGPSEVTLDIAQRGAGGGYLGAFILQGLVIGLGGIGAAILTLAWLIISLTMTLDLSVQEMFAWARPVIQRLNQRFSGLRRTPGSPAPGAGGSSSEPMADQFTPLHRPPGTSQAALQPPGVKIQTGVSMAPTVHWALPTTREILEAAQAPAINEEYIERHARLIEETLASLGAPSQVVEISRGPAITMFGVEPLFIETRSGQTRVRVGKIASLADDLALALAAPRIRIQAPVPGRSYVGIEVPNDEMTLVSLREVVESETFTRSRGSLRLALGKDVSGHPKATDLTTLPHLLIAGTTGSGKSVCVNSILTCLLLHNTPDDIRLILVDPKRVELTGYNGIPHLLAPVVVEIERVVGALQWMTREMDNRYHKFAEIGARNIQDYNGRMKLQGGKKLPYLIVVIDELADLMMIAPDETERTITRLAQLARATGIHLIIATQRPSVDVVTGLIKANFPARIAFAVASNTDSRVILDQPGAERLLGRGDMLFQAPDAASPVRLQGVFVSDGEIQRLVDFWRQQAGQTSAYAVPGGAAVQAGESGEGLPPGVPLKQVPMFEDMTPEEKGDPLLDEAIDLVRREGRASVSMLQRRFRIGYTRAARLVDTMYDKGIVGPPEGGTGVRQVLDYGPAAPPKED